MQPQVGCVAYRESECARCGRALDESPSVQAVALHILGPGGTVAIQCWLDTRCHPDPSEVQATSRELALRLVDWYRSTPTVWPALVTSQRA